MNTCFYSDEMGITLSDAHKDKVWNPPKKKVKVALPQKDIKLNCWGAISPQGVTSLHIYKGTLNTDTYCDILEEHKHEMDQMFPRGYNFQHDSLPAHVAAEDWMLEQNFDLVDFPTYSPDLSPIENVWSTLKEAVAVDNPKTEKQLRKSLLKNWDIVTNVNNLQPYFESLYNRYGECIDQKGNKLDY